METPSQVATAYEAGGGVTAPEARGSEAKGKLP
jgi:hypothetical protein